MSKNEQFKALIEQMVKREVRQLVPQLVKEVMANMILESKAEVGTQSVPNNSYKRHAIQENIDPGYEEYPTMSNNRTLDRATMAELMGYGDMHTPAPRSDLITASAISEHTGMPINVPVPDSLLNAFNKDYRPLMKALSNKNG